LNVSLRLPEEYYKQVKEYLMGRGFQEREVQHALWSVCREGTCATLYPSGALLLQGEESKHLADLILSLIKTPHKVIIGCDESGKGDVFGPLVVCCVVISPSSYKKVLSTGPKDCKLLKDEELYKKVKSLSGLVDARCVIYEPELLNQLYQTLKNLNRILDKAYSELIKGLGQGVEIRIDAYSLRNPFGSNVIFEPKGERDIAVSVASMFARAKFLEWLKRYGLPKGASKSVMKVAKEMFQKDPKNAKKLLKTFFLD
jgi:ribonuclease HIII